MHHVRKKSAFRLLPVRLKDHHLLGMAWANGMPSIWFTIGPQVI